MPNYEPTLVETMQDLRKEGYTEDFNVKFDSIICKNACLMPSEFEVDKTFRFDGATNPSDESILYAISSTDGKIKGVLVNSYGTYSDEMTNELMKKLS
ncbi:phosphoribosylpyrophosphate synthetase [Algoriphagus namhaensis]